VKANPAGKSRDKNFSELSSGIDKLDDLEKAVGSKAAHSIPGFGSLRLLIEHLTEANCFR
jgi:hypothetical protein